MLCAAFAVLASAFVILPNINRMNMAFLPILYFAASGFALLLDLVRPRALRFAAASLGAVLLVTAFAVFARTYCTQTRATLSAWFFDGLGDAIEYADSLNEDEVCVTDSVNMPYIYVLFYTQTSSEEFRGTVVYANPDGAFRQVTSFGKWQFGLSNAEQGEVCVVSASESEGMEVLAEFGLYRVCRAG